MNNARDMTRYIVELRLGGPFWIEGKGWATTDDTKATRYDWREAGQLATQMHGFRVASVTSSVHIRTISCGCCTGIGDDPNRDRCTCHFHQDMPRGLPPHVCAHHAEHGHPMVTTP